MSAQPTIEVRHSEPVADVGRTPYSAEQILEFNRIRTNEQSAIRAYINKFVGTDKFCMVAAEDRFAVFKQKRDEKLKQRVTEGKGCTRDYPGLYDEAKDDVALKNQCRLLLNQELVRSQNEDREVDRDDEEDLSSLWPQRLKREAEDDIDGESEGLRKRRRSSYVRGEDEEEEPIGLTSYHKAFKKPVIAEPVSRGMAFKCEGTDSGDIKISTKTGSINGTASKAPPFNVALNESKGRTGDNEARRGTKRRWKWVSGPKMIVWPPESSETDPAV